MSAPSSSSPLRRAALVAVALAALVAAGCTVPGSSRLQGPPEGLPPSLDYVTADVLGFTLYDTDPESKLWAGLGEERAEAALRSLHEPVFGDADVDSWIGDAAGVVIREFDLDGRTETATLYFADVRDFEGSNDPMEFGDSIGEAGWIPPEDELGDPVRFERDHGEYRALAWFDGAVVAARSDDALDTFLDAADEYAVPDRKAMSEYAVEASERVPMAFVFRSDLLRTQVRRPFEDDPALLEFARWATDSNTLVALRDGWVGVAPPIDRDRDAIRIVGASEWVPDLARDIELKPVKRDVLEVLKIRPDFAVAIHDPGQQWRELVRAITVGAGQYVTEQDVSDEDRVKLLPVLDALDGDAAISYTPNGQVFEAHVRVDEPKEVASDVGDALGNTDLQFKVDPANGGVHVTGSLREQSAAFTLPASHEFGPLLDRAGTPPRPPVAWFWAGGVACFGNKAGWITFDGTDELRLSIDIEDRSSRGGCAPRMPASHWFDASWLAAGGPLG